MLTVTPYRTLAPSQCLRRLAPLFGLKKPLACDQASAASMLQSRGALAVWSCLCTDAGLCMTRASAQHRRWRSAKQEGGGERGGWCANRRLRFARAAHVQITAFRSVQKRAEACRRTSAFVCRRCQNRRSRQTACHGIWVRPHVTAVLQKNAPQAGSSYFKPQMRDMLGWRAEARGG